MKTFIILAVCVAASLAGPPAGGEMLGGGEIRRPPIPIARLAYENSNQGQYSLDALGGDQTHIREQGGLRNLGDEEGPVVVSQGSYSYVGTDGLTYTVTWKADENGFQPQGAHLPTPPPIPAEHQRQ